MNKHEPYILKDDSFYDDDGNQIYHYTGIDAFGTQMPVDDCTICEIDNDCESIIPNTEYGTVGELLVWALANGYRKPNQRVQDAHNNTIFE